MENNEIIKQVYGLLRQLKTPYLFLVRQDDEVRSSAFPTIKEVGELLARSASGDKNVGDILTEAMKHITFKPTNK
jgi:hypothetical protein